MSKREFDFLKIERSLEGKDGEVDVYGYGRYPRYSVLAGQTRRVYLDSFPSVAEAKKAYPKAKGDGTTSDKVFYSNDPLGPVAPGWFSESAAGERWNDDY